MAGGRGRNTDSLINTRTLSKICGVSRQAIVYRCQRGTLPHISLEGNYLFNSGQVDYALKLDWAKKKSKTKQQELLK